MKFVRTSVDVKKNLYLVVSFHVYYLDPWCKKPKQSWALDENLKYNPVSSSPRRNSKTFSVNLEAENRTPAPCSRKSGENRTGRGISLAASGVP